MRQTAVRLVLLVLLGSVVVGAMTGPVAAQTYTGDCSEIENETNVEQYDSCNAENLQESGYTQMLTNVFQVAHTTLQYAGFVTVFVGAVLWFTARRSSERAQTGVWLLLGGLAMIVFYFGFTAFVSLLKWIAEGSSS